MLRVEEVNESFMIREDLECSAYEIVSKMLDGTNHDQSLDLSD